MTDTLSPPASRPYGLWDSPITPKSLASSLRLGDPQWDSDGRTLVWLEGRSDRGVLVTASLDSPAARDLTTDLSVRAMVGYGGGDFTVGHGAVFFVSGNRLYRQELAGGEAVAITPVFGECASPALSPDGAWLLFVHSYERKDVLAVVDTRGKHWPVKLHEGRDFYMQPAWSPDGKRVAWIAWDHPNMPWDGTDLMVADFTVTADSPALSNVRSPIGGPDTAIFQPEYLPDGSGIVYVSDEGGIGQLYLYRWGSGEAVRLTNGSGDYAKPAWAQGMRSFTVSPDSRAVFAIRNEQATHRLERLSLSPGEATETILGEPFTALDAPRATGGGVALAASGSTVPARIISVDPGGKQVRTWRYSAGETTPPWALSTPRHVTWPTTDGDQAHGLFYAPRNDRFASPGLPPLMVLVHGGPTSQVFASYQGQTQFFTSRGYAVLQVNYRGSTGYGRDYMLKLRGTWGIPDVEDSRTGALWLAEQGLVDAKKRVIMGGSAGGFTTLQSLVVHPGFYTAGICLFGVSNHFTLASDTHKFEERYLDTMLGPLPEAAAIYRERSPIFHADAIVDPICVFQGDIDRVVPRAQSDEIVASLKRRSVQHEYHVYEGEGHGWRKAETIEHFNQTVDRFLRTYVVFA